MTQTNLSPVGRPRANRLVLVVAVCATLLATAAIAVAASPGSDPGSGNAALAAADPNVAAAASPGADASASPDGSTKPEATSQPGRGHPSDGPWGIGGFGLRGPGDSAGWPGAPFVGRGITITAIDGTKLSLETDDGWTRTIDAADATITRSGQTIEVSDLKVGDDILFHEQRNDDGSYTVTTIVVGQAHVSGVVSGLSGNTFTVTERDGSTSVVTVDDSTTYTLGKDDADKSALKDGVQVDVEGSASGDTFAATAVHVFPARVWGKVTAMTDSTITVTQRDGTSATINVDDSTTYHVRAADTGDLSDIALDDVVMAQGTLKGNDSLDATDVWVGSPSTGPQRGPFGRPIPGGSWGGRGWGGPGWPDHPKEPNANPSTGEGA